MGSAASEEGSSLGTPATLSEDDKSDDEHNKFSGNYYVHHGLADRPDLVPQFRIFALGRVFDTLEQEVASSGAEYAGIEILGQNDSFEAWNNKAWHKHVFQQLEECWPDLIILEPGFETNTNTYTPNMSDFVAELFRFQLTRGSHCILLDSMYTTRWEVPILKQLIGEELSSPLSWG